MGRESDSAPGEAALALRDQQKAAIAVVTTDEQGPGAHSRAKHSARRSPFGTGMPFQQRLSPT
jgi:hypothetical protein